MDRRREEIHELLKHKYSLKTWDKTVNNLHPENVHNMRSGALGQWIGKRINTCTFNTNMHT